MGNASETNRPSLIVEPLASRHDRAAFSCGTPRLDEYLQRYAVQNRKRDLAQCFVLTPRAGTSEIMGYYTLSGHAIEVTALPSDLARRLPTGIPLPATLLGQMAVDTRYQGQGYGEKLVLHALRTALRATREVASIGVVVDALTDELVRFYAKPTLGFVELRDRPRHLTAPMNRIRAMFPDDAADVPDVFDLTERATQMRGLLNDARDSLQNLSVNDVSGRVGEIIDDLQQRLDALQARQGGTE